MSQGQILADALGQRFEDVLKAVAPAKKEQSPSRTPAERRHSEKGPPAFPPAPPMGKKIPKDRIRWMESELKLANPRLPGPKPKLGDGSEQEFVDGVKQIKERKQIDVINKWIKDHGDGKEPPRMLEARARVLFQIMLNLQD